MYEQTNPYLIYEPDGVIDLKGATFTQINDRRVAVAGAIFYEAEKKTLKLEGVRKIGYRTVSIAGIADPLTIEHFSEIEKTVLDFTKMNSGLSSDDYTLTFRKYGGHESSLGIVIDAIGKTQEIANTVCALARSRTLHCDYKGRKSSAGNLAFPFSPSDLHAGEVFEFSVFHLTEVDSLEETAIIRIEEV